MSACYRCCNGQIKLLRQVFPCGRVVRLCSTCTDDFKRFQANKNLLQDNTDPSAAEKAVAVDSRASAADRLMTDPAHVPAASARKPVPEPGGSEFEEATFCMGNFRTGTVEAQGTCVDYKRLSLPEGTAEKVHLNSTGSSDNIKSNPSSPRTPAKTMPSTPKFVR